MVIFEDTHKKIVQEQNCILYYSDGVLFSKVYLDEPLKYSFYTISTVLGLLNNSKKILILGTGLGTSILQLKELIPESEITTVDIDEEVFSLGKKYFELSRYDDINYIVADAVEYVKSDKNYYDYIMVDLYDGSALLRKFVEVDFLHNLYCRLNENGILILNSSMRDFGYFEGLCSVNNPLRYIYHNMFLAGFKDLMKLDFNISGWIYCPKSDIPTLFQNINNIQTESKYVKVALEVLKKFSCKIDIRRASDSTVVRDELMGMYRDYLINLIVKIRRGVLPAFLNTDQCGRNEIAKLFIDYVRKRVKQYGIESVVRNMFISEDIDYFKELNSLLQKYQYSLEDVADIVMLPGKDIVNNISDVIADKAFEVFGYYQYDKVSVSVK